MENIRKKSVIYYGSSLKSAIFQEFYSLGRPNIVIPMPKDKTSKNNGKHGISTCMKAMDEALVIASKMYIEDIQRLS